LAGPEYSLHSEERANGVRRAYSSTHLVLAPEDIVFAGAHFDDGYRAGRLLFESRSRNEWPTAITCYNDLVAMGLVKAIIDLGLRCPQDVSVVGFDDIKFCDTFLVPLTTVRVPKYDMGNMAAQMLIQHIESRETVAPRRVFLDAALVVRASTSSPVNARPAAGSGIAQPADSESPVEDASEVGSLT
jgi:LacI family transcriptional regulator/LacI family repressor for deo operon, udp, cdd, tsx, nupC, and nupG